MQPKIQFTTTSDGVRIAYTRIGQGPPLLYARMMTSFAAGLELELPDLATLAASTSLTLFDLGGTGASQRDITDLSVDARVRELEAVATCIAEDWFTLAGFGMCCLYAAAYAAAHPERVTHLLCIDPAPSDPARYSMDFLRDNWTMSRRFIANEAFPQGPLEKQRDFGRAIADCVEHEMFLRMVEAVRDTPHDEVYGKVRVPTLMIQGVRNSGDRERLEPLAAAVPGCEMVLLEGTSLPATMEAKLEAFRSIGIELRSSEPVAQSETAIIFFADIVDSTALTERMGDAAFRAQARELDEMLRKVVREHGDSVIDAKTLGDGILATFPAAARAVAAAMACADAAKATSLLLHVGLHAGDVIREDNNVFGGAVNIAARISALSAPGEVLVSDVVRALARTSSGVTFEDRGEHALKGVAEPQRVFAVRPASE